LWFRAPRSGLVPSSSGRAKSVPRCCRPCSASAGLLRSKRHLLVAFPATLLVLSQVEWPRWKPLAAASTAPAMRPRIRAALAGAVLLGLSRFAHPSAQRARRPAVSCVDDRVARTPTVPIGVFPLVRRHGVAVFNASCDEAHAPSRAGPPTTRQRCPPRPTGTTPAPRPGCRASLVSQGNPILLVPERVALP